MPEGAVAQIARPLKHWENWVVAAITFWVLDGQRNSQGQFALPILGAAPKILPNFASAGILASFSAARGA